MMAARSVLIPGNPFMSQIGNQRLSKAVAYVRLGFRCTPGSEERFFSGLRGLDRQDIEVV